MGRETERCTAREEKRGIEEVPGEPVWRDLMVGKWHNQTIEQVADDLETQFEARKISSIPAARSYHPCVQWPSSGNQTMSTTEETPTPAT